MSSALFGLMKDMIAAVGSRVLSRAPTRVTAVLDHSRFMSQALPSSAPLVPLTPHVTLMADPIKRPIYQGRDRRLLPMLRFGEADAARVPEAVCPSCQSVGSVGVTPFRWNGERHLQWRCSGCRHVWIESERRHGAG